MKVSRKILYLLSGTLLLLLIFQNFAPISAKAISYWSLKRTNYYDDVVESFQLTKEELELLAKNEFIVLNRNGTDDLISAYKFYWFEDLPIVITSDIILHLWHVLFDEVLKSLEEEIFYPLLSSLIYSAANIYLNEINLTTAADSEKDIAIYLLVAANLTQTNIEIPFQLENEVSSILNCITNEEPFINAFLLLPSNSRFVDDFTQYKPRGHYTESIMLEHYFRLFKWLSRVPFIFDSHIGARYVRRTPDEMISSTVDLVWAIKNARFEWNGVNMSGFEITDLIDLFLTKTIGYSYSITLRNIDHVCSSLSQSPNWHFKNFNYIKLLQESILSNNSIPEPYFEAIVDEYTPHYDVSNDYMTPKSFYFIGERITLDSYALDRLVYPFLPANKTLPNGLEFAVACLESNRAKKLLESEYQDQYIDINNDIENWDEDEKDTVLWKWTSAFKNLLQPVSLPNSDVKIHYPEFMDKKQWQDEKLTTVLGSWAQLRHDSILYGRQSYSAFLGCSTPDGYVEPYPEFFARLQNTVNLYRAVLEECNIFNIFDLYEINIGYSSFDAFDYILENLEEIAMYELKGTPLTEEQQDFITSTYSYSKVGCVYEDTGWIIRFLQTLKREFKMSRTSPYVSLIADIHSDPNTNMAMEIGTGLLEHLICIVPGFNNSKILAVGPVFSYYEFYVPMDKRMTDEEWRGIVYSFDSVEWFRGPWSQTYMVSTQKTTSNLGYAPTYYPPDWYTPAFSDVNSPYGELNFNLQSESSPIWIHFAFSGPVLCFPIIYALFFKPRKEKK